MYRSAQGSGSHHGGPAARRWRLLRAGRAVIGLVILALVAAACGADRDDTAADDGGTAADGDGTATDDGDATEEELEPVDLSFQEIFGPGTALGDSAANYGEAVGAATGGAVDFTFHWSNSLVPSAEVADAMVDGLLDMATTLPAYTPADLPINNWVSSMGFMTTPAYPAALLQGIGAHMEFALNAEAVVDEWASRGIKQIGAVHTFAKYDMLCKEPIETLEDARGKRVRVAGDAWAREAENLGMEPVTLVVEEIYEGYQRGIVDCVMTNPGHFVDSGLWELGGYHVPVELTGWNQHQIAISLRTWDSLPLPVQQALWDEFTVWLETYVESQFERYWRFATEGPEAHGIELLELDAEVDEQIKAHQQAVLDSMVENAPATLDDPQALVEEYERLHDKWLGIVDELGFDTEGVGLKGWIDSMEDPSQPPDIDIGPWLERVRQEVMDPLRPS